VSNDKTKHDQVMKTITRQEQAYQRFLIGTNGRYTELTIPEAFEVLMRLDNVSIPRTILKQYITI
jgi:hypothetical protein